MGNAGRSAPVAVVEVSEIDRFSCFVPRAVLEGIVDEKIRLADDFDIVVDRCSGALVFCDASGFTAVTEAFNKQPNGAERLGNVINDFFTSLIQIINFWGGDIIKFAGDAVTIVWGVDDSLSDSMSTYKIDPVTACKLACQCCLDLHRNLNGFPAGIEDRVFTLHIGVGYGPITILQVGGTLDRWDFVVAGPPVTQISIAEPLASSGDTVLSPEVVATLRSSADGGGVITEEVPDSGQHHKLVSLAGEATAAPPPLEKIRLEHSCILLLKRFIPPPIYKRLNAGFNAFSNELRQLSVIFVSVKGLDVDTHVGSIKANSLMQYCQKSAYLLEGSVNKFSVDDKGVVVLLMFGLPPVYHMDDPIRAVLCSLRIGEGLKTLGLACGIGVATGRVWVGTVGCDIRKEYTALGDTVNLAARLMGKAKVDEVLCDQTTHLLCSHAIEFEELAPVKMKGKADLVPMFRPPGRLKKFDEQKSLDPAVAYWPGWRQTSVLRRLFFPPVRFRPFVANFDLPLPVLDYNGYGPCYPWEIKEPWLPTLRNAMDLGGVMVIQGREVQGSLELVEYLKDLAEASGHQVFICSNTPEASYLPVANVPLLAFRKLCTDVVFRWKKSQIRKQKGYTAVDEKNSIYSLTKELTHPLFHWRLTAMKAVVKGLVLPRELPRNQPVEKWNHRTSYLVATDGPAGGSGPGPGSVSAGSDKGDRSSSVATTGGTSKLLSSLKNLVQHSRGSWNKAASVTPDVERSSKEEELVSVEDAFGVHSSVVVPAICSLINGYTMNERTVIIVRVRQGTSLYSSMDGDSWKTLALLANMAALRRRRRVELECQNLRRWRRRHSWSCPWCKGVSQRSNGEAAKAKWTSRCRPPATVYFPPFLLVVVCSQNNVRESSRLCAWARECGLFMNLGKLSRSETRSFLSYYYKTSKKKIPGEVVDYVHRVSAGYLNYVALTARQLLHHDAIEAVPVVSHTRLGAGVTTSATTTGGGTTRPGGGITGPGGGTKGTGGSTTGTGGGTMGTGGSTTGTGTGTSEEKPPPRADSQVYVSGAATSAQFHGEESVATTSEEDLADYDTVQERKVARDAALTERERRIVIRRRRVLPTCCGVLVGFKFEGNDVAQLRGCVVERDVTFQGNIITGMGHWIRRGPGLLPGTNGVRAGGGPGAGLGGIRQISEGGGRVTEEGDGTERDDDRGETRGEGIEGVRGMDGRNVPNHFGCPGPVEYAEKEGSLTLHSRMTERIFGVPFPEDNDRLVRLIEPSSKQKRLVVTRDLRSVPYIAQLRAATMMLIEALEPEEQLVAKCASVFTLPFCFYELSAIFPKAITLRRLEAIVESLLRRELLEICDPPTDAELEELDLYSVLKAFARHPRDDPSSTIRTDDELGSSVKDSTTSEGDLINEAHLAEEALLRHASLYRRSAVVVAPTGRPTEDPAPTSNLASANGTSRPSDTTALGVLRFDDNIIRPKDKDIHTFNKRDVQGSRRPSGPTPNPLAPADSNSIKNTTSAFK
ncbi:adenylate/guanylate cyclase [Gregarina niphandrodes]|uniref:Adenylate/guanylate cyclase n=1 Tax=Gregarina niphandrodes TaxID=110365 RepID=A0A023B8Y8_GRENI|nr:adenylate/guanylate cyclase [Gregarina niphandrodes]EZG70692.1 adenylate/guanylate cyclase [Gregarina niphandrodes]|eukprot:XP_011129875.1 adenylate/guanylate cyclase [Gregarina niphandrodes]